MDKEKFFNLITILLFGLLIILSINIFNSNYVIDIDKVQLAKFFTNTLNFKNLFNMQNNNNQVDIEIHYIKYQDKYINSTPNLIAIEDGVIIYCDNYKIVISQNDQYTLYFKGLFDYYIRENDYIEKGSIIALYYEPFELYLLKDGEKYSYEEYLANSF